MLKVDREDNFFNKHPKNGVRLVVDLQTDASAKKLNNVSGRFKLMTGGKSKTFNIENPTSFVGESLQRPEFDDIGVAVEIKSEDSELRIEFDGNHEPIFIVQAVGPDGKEHPKKTGFSNGGGGDLYQYSFSFDGSVPDDVEIAITIVTDLKEIEVPFSATNLKISKKPKNGF